VRACLTLALLGLAGIGLFVRPWVSIDRSTTDAGVAGYVETMQRGLNLPVDGSRGYAEASLRWVAWYVGWPLLIAAFVAAGCLTWRVLRGRELRWLPILLVYLCSSVLVLLRPGITPDHPWADRRLVVEVLPCVILLATWTAATVGRWAVRRRVPWLVVPLVAAFLVPAGVALTPVAVQRTEQSELAASDAVCRLLRPSDTVIVIDPLWMPVIRARCGLPVAARGTTRCSGTQSDSKPSRSAAAATSLQKRGLTLPRCTPNFIGDSRRGSEWTAAARPAAR